MENLKKTIKTERVHQLYPWTQAFHHKYLHVVREQSCHFSAQVGVHVLPKSSLKMLWGGALVLVVLKTGSIIS
jgi:hypothetical protein